ncbi:MAG: thioredoxin fold domain-containing protein [Bacteroidota bacterium]
MNILKVFISSVFFLMLFGALPALGQSEISFFEGPLSAAKTQATEDGKLIFVDTYASWCGPCKMMARDVFTDPKVADYFNEHFINVKIDTDLSVNYPFLISHEIRSIPDLIFMDASGTVLARKKGFLSSDQFLKLAKKAQKKS